jgi:hypothetical protein
MNTALLCFKVLEVGPIHLQLSISTDKICFVEGFVSKHYASLQLCLQRLLTSIRSFCAWTDRVSRLDRAIFVNLGAIYVGGGTLVTDSVGQSPDAASLQERSRSCSVADWWLSLRIHVAHTLSFVERLQQMLSMFTGEARIPAHAMEATPKFCVEQQRAVSASSTSHGSNSAFPQGCFAVHRMPQNSNITGWTSTPNKLCQDPTVWVVQEASELRLCTEFQRFPFQPPGSVMGTVA